MQAITLIASLPSIPFSECMRTHCPKFCRGDAWFNQNIKLLLHCTWRTVLPYMHHKTENKKKKSTKEKAKDWPAFRKSHPTMLTL